jgi:hypothetical protein
MPAIAIDSPVGGLNTFDSVDNMPPTDAIILDNWIPRSGYCESRPGTTAHTANLGGSVETLTAYKGTTEFQLIAGANGTLNDVTDGNITQIGSGYTNDRWQTAMINDKLIFVNGADPEMAWDGTTLTNLDFTGTPGLDAPPWVIATTYALDDYVSHLGSSWVSLQDDNTGNEPVEGSEFWLIVDLPGRFIGVVNFKGRAYYWQDNDLSFWYTQAQGYQGELEEFPLGFVLQQGGYIVSMFTWTVDSGTGPDDMLVITFNTGEFILYQGDDPGNLGYFEQVGRFEMPDPLAIRGQMKFGSDVIVMTRDGYVNLSTVLKQDQVSDYPAFSRKIARTVADNGQQYSEFYGHECVLTDNGFLLFNVPTGIASSYQIIRNASTGSWSTMSGLPIVTMEIFNDVLYMGCFDGLVRVLGGTSDSGEPIALDALPAYQYLDNPGSQKQITAAQVLSTHPDPALIGVTGFSDFTVPILSNTTNPPGPAGGGTAWNTELWNTVQWNRSGGPIADTTKGWQNVHAFGYAVTVAVQMKISSQNIIWRQTGWRYRSAGAQ